MVPRKSKPARPKREGPASPKLGRVLLDLRNGLRQVERCRRALKSMGFPKSRWIEIVQAVSPELRFAANPSMMDAIIVHLEAAGEPMGRENLVYELRTRGAGQMEHVRRCITAGLRRETLVLLPGNKIALSRWMKRRTQAE